MFPISTAWGEFKAVIETFVQELEEYSSLVRDVYVLAEDPKAFCEAVTMFNEVFVGLFEDN